MFTHRQGPYYQHTPGHPEPCGCAQCDPPITHDPRAVAFLLQQIATLQHDVLHLREIIMASFAEAQAAMAAETQAIHDLATRLAALPQPAATPAELDQLVATAQSNVAALQAIAPAP